MQIQSTNNSPNFGIKFVRPKKWNPEVLDTLMHSNLVKEIDAKYPYAKVRYRGPSRFNRDETLFMCGKSPNGYLYFVLNSKLKPRIDSMAWSMVDYINNMNLNKLEGDMAHKLEETQRAENIYKAAKESNKQRRSSLIEHISSLFWTFRM